MTTKVVRQPQKIQKIKKSASLFIFGAVFPFLKIIIFLIKTYNEGVQAFAQFGFTGRYDMEIRTFGGGRRLAECERLLSERQKHSGRLILLPIPTSRDKKYITGTTVSLSEVCSVIDGESLIAGYSVPEDITRRAEMLGARLYDAALDEDFLIKNAELTARGAIGYILTNGKKDLSDSSVGVVGYGRIGERLTRWLLAFGSSVTVYTSRREVAIELCEMGVSAQILDDGWEFSSLDLLVNTSPVRQLDEALLPESVGIIDLASGKVFSESVRAVKLSSIPDALFPLSAGRLYAEAILRAFSEDGK